MKISKIIFFFALLTLMVTTSFAKDMDEAAENHAEKTKRFIYILHEQWGIDVEKVSGKTLFLKDFGADSVDIMELVMAIEEDFDIVIADDDWERITTVNSAVELIIDIKERRRY